MQKTPARTDTQPYYALKDTSELDWTKSGEWSAYTVLSDPDAAKVVSDFVRLSADWRKATGASSFLTRRQAHQSYRGIVALGSPVLGLLINELRRGHYEWIEALEEITGEDAGTLPADRGNREAIACAWIAWGRKKGF